MESEPKFELYEKMARLQWLLQRHQLQTHAQHGPTGNTSRGQGRVLAMLKLQPEISTKDLSYLLGIRQQSLNELLNKLEKSGHVVRVPSEKDKRVMMIKLTEKGKEEQQDVPPDFSDICQCLSEEEQAAFGGYLDRIIAALEEQLGDDCSPDMEEWIRGAKSRMTNEQFERMISMMRHGREHHGWGGRRPEDMDGGDYRPNQCGNPNDRDGRFFDPFRDGGRRGGFPFGRHGKDAPPPPPAPPQGHGENDGD